MGGRRSGPTYHAFTGNTRPASWNPERIEEECFDGEWNTNYSAKYHHPVMDATCRDCGKAWGKIERAKVADRITVEKIESSSIKSGVIVSVDGVKRAIVLMRNGWGECWRVMQYRERSIRDSSFYGAIGGDRFDTSIYRKAEEIANGLPIGVYNIHKTAMDAMISVVPALVDAGKLPTEEEEKAAGVARAEERERDRLAAVERDRQRREDRMLAIDAIKELIEKPELTNMQKAGLEAALKFL